MASFPSAAAQLRPPEQTDLLGNYARLMQLHDLAQQSQLRQQQLQGEELRNQQAQQQRQSRHAVIKTIKDANGDPDKVNLDTLVGNGVIPEEADNYLKAQLSQRQALGTLDSNTRSALAAIDEHAADAAQAVKAVKDPTKRQVAYASSVAGPHPIIAGQQSLSPQMRQQALQSISQLPSQVPSDDDLDTFIALHNHGASVTKQVSELQKSQAETFKDTQQGNEAVSNIQKTQVQLPGLAAESQAKAKFAGPQAQAELGKTRAQTAEAYAATAKSKAETENLGQLPVFAVDPTTNPPQRVMTTRPEAQQKGYTNIVPVKEGDVQKQTDAVAMTNDVQLNVSRYRSAMNRMYQEPMNGKQMAALTALTPEKLGIEIGHGFGISLPDFIQKITNATAFSVLSSTQKQAVLGYYSTLASVPAAQKALTNIGRSNKEMLDLELRTIPTPLMDHETFNLGMDRFQGNVSQTAAKNVRIPGMPTAQSIREEIEGPPPDTRPPINFNLPKPMTLGGLLTGR